MHLCVCVCIVQVFPYLHTYIITDYKSQEDLIHAVAASSHVPGYVDGSFMTRFRNHVRHTYIHTYTYTHTHTCTLGFAWQHPNVGTALIAHSLRIHSVDDQAPVHVQEHES